MKFNETDEMCEIMINLANEFHAKIAGARFFLQQFLRNKSVKMPNRTATYWISEALGATGTALRWNGFKFQSVIKIAKFITIWKV